MDLSGSPPLGLAHFTAIAVPPLKLVSLAARTGYAAVGLRLYPAFPGAPFSEIPAGSAASHEMQERLRAQGHPGLRYRVRLALAGVRPGIPGSLCWRQRVRLERGA